MKSMLAQGLYLSAKGTSLALHLPPCPHSHHHPLPWKILGLIQVLTHHSFHVGANRINIVSAMLVQLIKA